MKIGFIGLGIMGESMSENIVKKHNDEVFVFDFVQAKVDQLAAIGAKPAASSLELAQNVDIIISMVPKSEHSKAVYESILPAKNGSLFVSPFIGWKEANGEDCKAYIENIVQIYKNFGFYGKTEIICAAIRNPKQIADCAVAGADIVTTGLEVYKDCMKHAYTNQGLGVFRNAWDNTVTE